MGICGLTRFVKSNCRPAREVLEDADGVVLAIDGVGLVYHLYYQSKLEWEFGGEMESFREMVKEFVRNLVKATGEVVVFLDELHQVDAVKKDCTLKRRNEALKVIGENMRTGVVGFVLPLLAVEVFCDACKALGVSVVNPTLDSEADREIAMFASTCLKRCIVLTNDSDFFVFDSVKEIVLFEDLLVTSSQAVVRVFTRSQLYSIIRLPRRPVVLCVLACLIGNDYSDPKHLARWQYNVQNLIKYTKANGAMCLREDFSFDVKVPKKKSGKKKRKPRKATRNSAQHRGETKGPPINYQTLIQGTIGFLRVFVEQNAHVSDEELLRILSDKIDPNNVPCIHEQLVNTYSWYCNQNVDSTGPDRMWWWSRPVPEAFSGVTIFEVLAPLRKELLDVNVDCGPCHIDCWQSLYMVREREANAKHVSAEIQKVQKQFIGSPVEVLLALSHLLLHIAQCQHIDVPFNQCENCVVPWEMNRLEYAVTNASKVPRIGKRKPINRGDQYLRIISLINLLQGIYQILRLADLPRPSTDIFQ
eukprot:CAMPEP_0203756324 /NCGR_PEP_ID=MMETSP0098-20131031/9621_1 /ASSEMBLY_ACC=CAM_ASM_000208 /TAXON_ID=96639 /ORGANISM=" , Strain NY0313808BC1" /LENGTH=530 /DNA_ID=CAMNT_0050648161 /DNA_START=111 /DNA_END=1700 /DNA_ORIENTATION=+